MRISRWWRRPLTRSVVMLGATVLAAGLGQLAMPAAAPMPTTVVVPISSLALVCPGLPADTPGLDIAVKAALLGGTRSAALALQAAKTVSATVNPGGVTSVHVAHSASALFSADGEAASQLVADASIAGTSASTQGFAAFACQPPSSSQWMVGGSSRVGRTDVLSIANVDDTPATVDVEVWTEAGKSTARALQGIEVPARSLKQLSLAMIEPDRTLFAVHVIASSGQVTSTIIDRGQQGLVSLGIDAIEPVSSPLASALVGVVPDGASGASLALLSPGTPTAARVSLVTSDGTYPLAGAENLTLDADKLLLIPIPDAALAGDVVVLVQADAEVLSGVVERMSIKGGADLASASMMSPIYRVASLTVDATVSEATALLYSDVETDVTAVLRTGTTDVTQTVHLRAAHVTRVRLVGSAGQAHLLSIRPAVDGTVSGSVLLKRASVGMTATTVVPLTSVRGFVTVPPVAPDVSR